MTVAVLPQSLAPSSGMFFDLSLATHCTTKRKSSSSSQKKLHERDWGLDKYSLHDETTICWAARHFAIRIIINLASKWGAFN